MEILRQTLNLLIPLCGWLLALFVGPRIVVFFLPFVIGWILAWIANVPVRFLEQRMRLVRRHGTILTVGVVLAAVIGLLYLLISRLVIGAGVLVRAFPRIWEEMQPDLESGIATLEHALAYFPPQVLEGFEQIKGNLGETAGMLVQKAASPTVQVAGSVAKGIPGALVYCVVSILSAYFFILEHDRIIAAVSGKLPQWLKDYWANLRKDVRQLIFGYFLAQFKIMFVVWVILGIGFAILGVRFAPVIGFLVAFLDFLPVFGTGTVLMPWALLKLLAGEYAFAAGLALIYVLTQVVRQIVQPKLVGDSMGLNPLLTLLFLFLGFKIRGIAGMILAVPVGLFFMKLYKYGAFDSMIAASQGLCREINRFRKNENK